MVRGVMVGLFAVLLASASGCASPDRLLRQFIAELNQLADAVEKGESPAKQKVFVERVNATAAKLEKLNLAEDQKKALVEKHRDELEQASLRLHGVLEQVGSHPTLIGLEFGGFFKK